MSASLDGLPIELYISIISHFDDDHLQQSILALSRAIPRSPVPTKLLYERISLKSSNQVFRLYTHLRSAPQNAFRVRCCFLECWTVDADVFVNLMTLLPSITHLRMCIGPNFAPEHMEEIFSQPREGLELISLQFRPYVQRATYYQFLKGAYFDSTLQALSRWSFQTLTVLSIVQDPLDPSKSPTNFAQPLVFFRLDPLSTLAISPVCCDLKQFRLRVPSRQVCRHLHALPRSFPHLELLDMSTDNVTGRDLEPLLGHLPELKILVLDGCPIISQRTDAQVNVGEPFVQWMELGQALALAGVKRATEREKKLKMWLEEYYSKMPEEIPLQQGGSSKKSRKGRKGLATASFSLRVPSPERKGPEDVTIPVHRIPSRKQKVRVLPTPPNLLSLATNFPGDLTPETYEAVKTQFERGWATGIARLMSIYLRLQTSYRNGVVRVVRFADQGTPEWEEEGEHGGQGLAGLVDVCEDSAFILAEELSIGSASKGACPTLCLAGSGRGDDHVVSCGHRSAWDAFKDGI